MNGKTILTDAINDLSTVDNMIKRGRIDEAKAQLVFLFSCAGKVLGGNSEIRNLMDQFQVEFSKRYQSLYSR